MCYCLILQLTIHSGVSPKIEDSLHCLRLYDFLWQQDMHITCRQILSSEPKQEECISHIENFILLEEKIEQLSSVFTVGPLQLSSKPVKNTLRALAVAWKIEFVTYLQEQAKVCRAIVGCYGMGVCHCTAHKVWQRGRSSLGIFVYP